LITAVAPQRRAAAAGRTWVPRTLVHVLRCPHCGEENAERARFCIRCGSPLAVPEPRAEERKIVTVVFAELAGVDERADPEDLKRELAPYHAQVRKIVEGHGGTVDKFMGEVVLGVFGAPTAHEDDPERAVRAALRLTGVVADGQHAAGPLAGRIRIGIDTGEAIVARPGTGPTIGEAVTGDVVNTASRITSIAAPGEVIVGEPTYRATAFAFDYETRDPVTVKGKAAPLAVWRAVEARSRMGIDLRPRTPTPFVGRREERSILEAAFRRVLNEPSVQIVTITGEPGVGKTRLVHELGLLVDDYPELVRWRQGRCLPYGEGISFWAFGEIVKAEAGILESDGPHEASAKLAASLAHLDDPAERDWIRTRLAPLAGVEGAGDVPRDELFTAWRRYVEMLASHSPTVLVFEDLQWADDALLGFIEHLADWVVGLPLFMCCTARPELYERHPSWGGGRRNASSIALPPLSAKETSMLLSALLDRTVLPGPTRAALLERSGGNPLYAEEFVRMVRDRGAGGADGAAEVSVPQTVQLLIGARLDTLPADHKALLQDAAVAGKVFWRGLVSSMGDLPSERANDILHELVGREFVRPSRTSSMRGDEEYAFWHVLVQDVAYGQMPRAVRGRKHLAVAAWIREAAGDRVGDTSELLAHHYGEALRIAEASGAATDELRRLTGEALMLAGERAKRLDMASAEAFFRRARDILPNDHRDCPRALAEAADTAANAGRFDEAERDFARAIAEYREMGDRRGLGETLARLAQSPTRTGTDARALLLEAIELLEQDGAGPELARAYSRMAGHLYVAGENADAVPWADKALALAESTGLEEEEVLALQYRGAARCLTGDEGGLVDLRRALRLGLEAGVGEETAIAYNNLAMQLMNWVGPRAAYAVYEEMIAFCRVRGFSTLEMWAEGGSLDCLYDTGEWDTLLERGERMLAWDRAHGSTRVGIWPMQMIAWVALRRGDLDGAASLVPEALARAREIGYAEYLAPVLMLAAEVAERCGDADEALLLTDEFLAVTEHEPDPRQTFLALAMRLLVSAGQTERARSLVEAAGDPAPKRQAAVVLTARAILADALGDDEDAAGRYREAVAAWEAYGFPLERGRCGQGAGRCLLRLGRVEEGVAELRAARAALMPLATRPFLDDIDELLNGVAAPA
jgi:class 3 adenylate cyclase/tetratricopeptide (TPR) repeat protein